jgi:hypothetical protein
MKRILFLFCAIMFSVAMWADDIIYLKNGEEIRSKINKIGTSVVEYRKVSNLEGPVYEINKEDISKIVYSNGEEDVFKFPSNKPIIDFDGEKLIAFEGKVITDSEYLQLAEKNCAIAYKLFKKGKVQKQIGTAFIVTGCTATAAGIACLLFLPNACSCSYDAVNTAGVVGVLAGPAFLATGIPLFCVGKLNKRQSYEAYNESFNQKTADAPELNLNFYGNSLGLALRF